MGFAAGILSGRRELLDKGLAVSIVDVVPILQNCERKTWERRFDYCIQEPREDAGSVDRIDCLPAICSGL